MTKYCIYHFTTEKMETRTTPENINNKPSPEEQIPMLSILQGKLAPNDERLDIIASQELEYSTVNDLVH